MSQKRYTIKISMLFSKKKKEEFDEEFFQQVIMKEEYYDLDMNDEEDQNSNKL